MTVYINALWGSFHGSDYAELYTLIPHLNSASPATRGITPLYLSDYPLFLFSLSFNYLVGGFNPMGYHFFNLMAHLAAGVCLYVLLRLMGEAVRPGPLSRAAAFFLALLWLTHPVQSATINYISERATILAALFYFLTLLLFIKGLYASPRRQILYFLAAGGGFLLSLASLAYALVLPYTLYLLYAGIFEKKIPAAALNKKKLRFFLAVYTGWLVFLTGPKLLYRILAAYTDESFSLGGRLLTELRVDTHYLALWLWPWPSRLHFDYLDLFSSSMGIITPPQTGLAVILWAFLAIAAMLRQRNRPLFAFGVCWVLLHCLSAAILYPRPLAAEPRFYLASAGLAIIMLDLIAYPRLAAFSRNGVSLFITRRASYAVVMVLAVILIFSLLTIWRNNDYQNEATLWMAETRHEPVPAQAYVNLGKARLSSRRLDDAERNFLQALRLRPHLFTAHSSLGFLYLEKKNWPHAVFYLEQALQVRRLPDNEIFRGRTETDLGLIYYYLAEAYRHLGSAEKNREYLAAFHRLSLPPAAGRH